MAFGPNHEQRRAGAGPERAQALRRAFRDQHEVPAGLARRPPPRRPRWRTRHGGIGGKKAPHLSQPAAGLEGDPRRARARGSARLRWTAPRSPERVPDASHFRAHVRLVEVVGAARGRGRSQHRAGHPRRRPRPRPGPTERLPGGRRGRGNSASPPRGPSSAPRTPRRPARLSSEARAADAPAGLYVRGNAACTLPARRLRRRACPDPLPPRCAGGPTPAAGADGGLAGARAERCLITAPEQHPSRGTAPSCRLTVRAGPG